MVCLCSSSATNYQITTLSSFHDELLCIVDNLQDDHDDCVDEFIRNCQQNDLNAIGLSDRQITLNLLRSSAFKVYSSYEQKYEASVNSLIYSVKNIRRQHNFNICFLAVIWISYSYNEVLSSVILPALNDVSLKLIFSYASRHNKPTTKDTSYYKSQIFLDMVSLRQEFTFLHN